MEALEELLTAQEVYDRGLLPYRPRVIMRMAREEKISCVRLSPKKIRFTERLIAGDRKAAESTQGSKTKPTRDPKYAGK